MTKRQNYHSGVQGHHHAKPIVCKTYLSVAYCAIAYELISATMRALQFGKHFLLSVLA